MTVEQRLNEFYQQVDQTKIETIPKIAQKYKGNEAKLFQSLAAKYPAQAHLLNGGGGKGATPPASAPPRGPPRGPPPAGGPRKIRMILVVNELSDVCSARREQEVFYRCSTHVC
jgi:hypothetical protein